MTAALARRSARALAWSSGGSLAKAMLQFVVQVLMARLLGPDAFGLAAAALLVIGVAGLVAEGGLPAALVQRQELDARLPGVALAWTLILSLSVAAAVALLSSSLAALLGDARLLPLILAAACIVPLHALSMLTSAVLQRHLAMRALQTVQLMAYALGYAVAGLLLAATGAGPWSVIAAFAVHALVVTLLAGLLGRRYAPLASWRPRLRCDQALLGYAFRTTLANLVNWCAESIDRLIVGRVAGPAALGLYTAAASLARAPAALLVSSVQPVALAAAARLHDAPQRLARGWLALLALVELVVVPSFVFLAWHADTVVAALLGPAWGDAVQPMAWLSLTVPFFVMFALTGSLLRGTDAVGSEIRVHLVVLVVMVPGLLLAASTATAVAAGVAAAAAARAAGMAHVLARRVGLPAWAPWMAWRGGVVLTLPVLLAAALSEQAIADPRLAAASAAAMGLAAAMVMLRVGGAWLLGPSLAEALRNRRTDSAAAARACRWLRLG